MDDPTWALCAATLLLSGYKVVTLSVHSRVRRERGQGKGHFRMVGSCNLGWSWVWGLEASPAELMRVDLP